MLLKATIGYPQTPDRFVGGGATNLLLAFMTGPNWNATFPSLILVRFTELGLPFMLYLLPKEEEGLIYLNVAFRYGDVFARPFNWLRQ